MNKTIKEMKFLRGNAGSKSLYLEFDPETSLVVMSSYTPDCLALSIHHLTKEDLADLAQVLLEQANKMEEEPTDERD